MARASLPRTGRLVTPTVPRTGRLVTPTLPRTRRLVAAAGAAAMAAGVVLTLGAPAGAGTSAPVTQAKKHLLVLSDMPKGWKTEKGTGSSGSSGGLPGGAKLASCIGVPASVIDDNSPSATGPYYEDKDGSLEVQDSVTVFPSASYAKTELAAMANTKTPFCVTVYMNRAGKSAIEAQADKAGGGATVGTITVAPLPPTLYGHDMVGIVMSIPITYKGVTVNAQLISANAIHGRLGQSITYNAYGAPFPTALAQHLSSVALGRL